MAVSIDGNIHKGKLQVKYGDNFPKPRRDFEIVHEKYGHCRVYVMSIGAPEWTEKLSVVIPMEYIITQIIDPTKEYIKEQKVKKIGLRLIK